VSICRPLVRREGKEGDPMRFMVLLKADANTATPEIKQHEQRLRAR
jgi:hypothetical protein